MGRLHFIDKPDDMCRHATLKGCSSETIKQCQEGILFNLYWSMISILISNSSMIRCSDMKEFPFYKCYITTFVLLFGEPVSYVVHLEHVGKVAAPGAVSQLCTMPFSFTIVLVNENIHHIRDTQLEL